MNVFGDSSAFYSYLDKQDSQHLRAKAQMSSLIQSNDVVVSSNYIIVETIALIQRRLGFDAVKDFQEIIAPLLSVYFVNKELHQKGAEIFLQERRRNLSLVDCVSFELMKQLGLQKAFAFDKHFEEQGFQLLD
ncbi:MAG: PIN domain-containing protein [Ignavibacteriales bacterium]|nr:PIN domain-containing protein [Ignavibacteriales bacterium]